VNAIKELFPAVEKLLVASFIALAMNGGAIAVPAEVPPKSSFSTDFTDLWGTLSEPGWGAQMIQTGSFIFVTIYNFGPDGKPTWFVAGLTLVAANTFGGNLYAQTGGSYFGVPWDPAALTPPQPVPPVGTAQFQATTSNAGVLTYTVGSVTVTKAVQRTPLTLDDYNGSFASILTQTSTSCTNAANNGTLTDSRIVQITQTGQAMSVVIYDATGGSCSLIGTYTQMGRNGRVDGTYTCTNGDTGTVSWFEMNNHVRQFNARTAFQSNNAGCLSTGRVTGVFPN
jgi:hypothetical protein